MLKTGAVGRKMFVGAAALMSAALFLIGRSFLSVESAEKTVSNDSRQAHEATSSQANKKKNGDDSLPFDPRLRLAQLELTENEPYEGSGRNIFRIESEHSLSHISPAQVPIPPSPPVSPVEPTIPLRFFGFISMLDVPRRGFFGDGDALFIASEGEIVDHRYRIVKIDSNSVEIEDLIEHLSHTLSLPA